jgi:hypothetical protein
MLTVGIRVAFRGYLTSGGPVRSACPYSISLLGVVGEATALW